MPRSKAVRHIARMFSKTEVAAEIVPEPERDGGELQPAAPAAAVGHGVVARRRGQVGHRALPGVRRSRAPLSKRSGQKRREGSRRFSCAGGQGRQARLCSREARFLRRTRIPPMRLNISRASRLSHGRDVSEGMTILAKRAASFCFLRRRLHQHLVGSKSRDVIPRVALQLIREHISVAHRHVRALAGKERQAGAGVAEKRSGRMQLGESA